MKTASTLIGYTVWLLLTLGMASQTQAIPVTYTYMGSTYTESTFPNVPGLTLNDRITASFTIDSASWGTEVNPAILNNISSGPIALMENGARVTTDPTGAVINWSLGGAAPGKDIFTGGNVDGSGKDAIFGDTFVEPLGTYMAAP